MPTSGFEPATPESQQPQTHAVDPRGHRDRLIYKAFVQNNIPLTLWLTAYLASLCTLQHCTVTSIRERGYHVPCFNVWSGIVCDNIEPPPRPDSYVTGLEPSNILISWKMISHGCLKLYLHLRFGDYGLSTIELHHIAGKKSKI